MSTMWRRDCDARFPYEAFSDHVQECKGVEMASGLKTTIWIEATSEKSFEEALRQCVPLAREHVIGMSFHLKSDPDTRFGVRTTKLRKRKNSNER